MRLQRQIEKLVSQQASEWIEVLETGNQEDREAFVAWLKESRRHVAEFLAMVAVDRELDGVDAQRQHDLNALLARLPPEMARVATLTEAVTEKKRRAVHWAVALSLAASIACAAVSGWWFLSGPGSWQTYSTAVGQQRPVELADGSLVNLNTDSRITVRMSHDVRDIRFTRGEALFSVAQESRRPFRVLAPDAVVQAVGTQFNVRIRGKETTVAVLEGRVSISGAENAPLQLFDAGEGAKIPATGGIQPLPAKDLRIATAWREGRLMFRDDTLEDITAEFNRYNAAPRFRLDGEAVKSRHYSGTFDADDPQSFAELLMRESDVSVERRDEEIVIRKR